MNSLISLFILVSAFNLMECVTIKDLSKVPDAIKKALVNTTHPEFVTETEVCDLTDDNYMKDLHDYFVEYMTIAKGYNFKSGTVKMSLIDQYHTKEEKDFFIAAICDEEYDNQPDAESKLVVILQGYLKRKAECKGVSDRKTSCKEDDCKSENR